MIKPTVVFLGDLSAQAAAVADLAREFGWSIEPAAGLEQLRQVGIARQIVAVVFDAASLGLGVEQALRALRKAVPNARFIPCHRFSEVVDWPTLADAGAFHALALPLDRGEVRQSLGFVWSARLKRTANVLAMRAAESRYDVAQLRDAS
jgi:DNA-binding NtrC family response regulator